MFSSLLATPAAAPKTRATPALLFFSTFVLTALGSSQINREAVVSRESIKISVSSAADQNEFDAFTIGNGAFAINVDATGFQTFPQVVSRFSLNTLSDWSFHSMPTYAQPQCFQVNEQGDASVRCGEGDTITGVKFASYGNPGGSCGNFTRDPTCDSPNSTSVVESVCVGKSKCTVPSGNAFWGDPCQGRVKSLAIEVTCSGPLPPVTRSAALEQFKYTYFDTPISNLNTTKRPFATDNNVSGQAQSWPMSNPQRVGLGELSLRLATPGSWEDPGMIPPSSVTNISAVLDVWSGGVSSNYTLEDAQGGLFSIEAATSVHPDADLVAMQLSCTAQDLVSTSGCPTSLRIAFAYANTDFGPYANDWTAARIPLHNSTVLLNDTVHGSLTIARDMDDSHWVVTCQWDNPVWHFVRTAAHAFVLLPPPGVPSTSVSLSCLWTPKDLVYPIGMNSSQFVGSKVATARALLDAPRFPMQPAVQASSASMWHDFWMQGAFLDLLASNTSDPRAHELQRRVILSRFLTRSNSAGSTPPQETGLLSNSWSGKFHLEMRFWHQAHWSLWGNPELLHRSNGFYFDLLPNATSLARFQGYKGARWLKMLGLANPLAGEDSMVDVSWLGTDFEEPPSWAPSGKLLLWESFNQINPILQWNQPHMIWLADTQRRAVNASQGPEAALLLMRELSPLVFATADYLASAPFFNESSGHYELGPPLLGGEEFGDYYVISRPTFETVYFAYALDVANEWRDLLGLPAEDSWETVSAGMSNLPRDPAMPDTYSFNAAAACCYVAPAQCPPGRFGGKAQCSPLRGHPMPAGILGMVNGRYKGDKYGVDVATANATIQAMVLNWGAGWGWDNP